MARKAVVAESLLSIADISRHFSLPESTTRYYCKRFAHFIPSVGDGRRRRYRRETLEVIAAVLEQMQKSRTAAAVEDALNARFPRNAVAVADADSSTALAEVPSGNDFFPSAALQILERQTNAIEGIAHLLQLVVQRLPAPSGNTAPEVGQLRQEVANLRVLLDSSEKTQQADLDQLRSWMTKVIRNRGGSGQSE